MHIVKNSIIPAPGATEKVTYCMYNENVKKNISDINLHCFFHVFTGSYKYKKT